MLPRPQHSDPSFRRAHRALLGGFLILLAALICGCASFSNPVADGIPVKRIPAEFLAKPKDDLKTLPLTALGQPVPDAYRLDAGDILGIYLEGVIGDRNQPLPVREQQPILQGAVPINLPPAVGYPIPVSSNGTLPLPGITPLKVTGMTLLEVEAAIKTAYVDEYKILKADQYRALVTLMRPRQYQIQVLRQETPQTTTGSGLVQANSRRGTANYLDLPAYQNDILNALTRTGGLPGLDSVNEVVVFHNLKDDSTKVTRIPVRIRKGQALPFKPSDVILESGDVVFIEARDTEVYYVGGLTIPRQYTLPRDYDLTVTNALALAGGPLVNGGFNQNNLQGSIIQSGLGSPSPSQVSVLRKTKNGGQINILVNINKALNDPRENLILQSGDFLILQETLGESLTRYLSTTIRLSYVGQLINAPNFKLANTYQGP